MTFSDTQFTSPFQQTFGAHTPEQSPPKRDGLEAALRRLPEEAGSGMHLWRKSGSNEVLGHFYGKTYGSRFRPIQRRSDGALLAIEADTHGFDGADWLEQSQGLSDDQLTASDRLLRMLHTLNHFQRHPQPNPPLLILNVHTRFLSAVAENHGWAFGRVLQALGLSTRLFVIQLSVRGVKDLAQFSFVTDNYRRNGFLTSVKAEDFVEAGSIIGQIRPDFVSLSTKESWTEQSFAALLDTAKRFHVHMITDAEATSATSERTSWSDSNALFHAGGWKQMHDNP